MPRASSTTDARLRLAIWTCGCAIVASGLSGILWAALLLVPFIGLIAVPCVLACSVVLLYAIPSMAYLLLAQTDPPSTVSRLFLPLNPVRNLGLTLRILSYVSSLCYALPRLAWQAGKHVLWASLLRRLETIEGVRTAVRGKAVLQSKVQSGTQGKEARTSKRKATEKGSGKGLFEDFAVFGIPYQPARSSRAHLLDVYLPSKTPSSHREPDLTPSSSAASSTSSSPPSTSSSSSTASPGRDASSAFPLHHAPDVDLPDPPTASTSTAAFVPATQLLPSPQVDSSPFFVRTSSSSTPRRPTRQKGKPVVVFVYDVGAIGPVRPRREGFCLLGVMLAEMGYVVVIPDITMYPEGNAEDTVCDLRHVLAWVDRNIRRYGGSSSQIYLAGHGLGAHLAMFTISQDAVVHSRDERLLQLKQTSTPMRKREELVAVPNGLRALEVYGGEVDIPELRGLILLSPVSDIIKQIRHESSLWLEHISPLRRALGPSQTMCMQNSLGHLLFAGKNVLRPDRLPGKVLIIHGARDELVPLDSAHWLSELLYGLDIPETFRPYRQLGHWDLVLSLMKGMEGEYTHWLQDDLGKFIDTPR